MRVALLYPTTQHGTQLRDALNELGAAVVYETAAASVDRDALENSGARVVVVNLGPDSDDYIDALYDVLDAGDYNVVFNEANVTEALQGWDHARWARNLASKILSRPEIATPPRPPGAQAVPTPVQTSASAVPIAEKPSSWQQPDRTKAEPPKVEAKVEQKVEIPKPAAERTTVEMPVPQEFRIDEPAPLEDLGVADLGEFAEGTDFTGEPTTKEIPAAIPVPPQEQQERADDVFAAELDALFAAADTAKQSSGELDIGLPSDFDLTDLSATGVEESIELSGEEISLGDDAKVNELHDEFPAIFDQLDVAAADVP